MPEEYLIPPGGHWSGTVPGGHRLRIVDLEGGKGGLIFFATTLTPCRTLPCSEYTQGCTNA
ncbi:MAG: hypothetical protein CM1200mP18_04620 [Gammaproteobacteria bacterium]|nr:MAG: hypothetical protein CM1200mP18_04620 [Gammaproteobacteria bacterium]